MLGRARRAVSGVARRLIASYVVVAIAAVVLVEAFVLLYQVPRLLSSAQLQAQVRGTAASYWDQLSERYPGGIPTGALLGERGQRPDPGSVRTTPAGSMLIVPAVTGTIGRRDDVTAVVAIAQDGRIIASSAPSRYMAGQPATRGFPVAVAAAIRNGLLKGVPGGTGATPYGRVAWTLYAQADLATLPAGGLGFAYLYVQAPLTGGFVNPLSAWEELGQISGSGRLDAVFDAALFVVVPVGVLFALLASRRLARRVRRLERATVAAADGDYTFTLPPSGRDDVGRLEATIATMTRQLSSALAAERVRATSEARAAERSRIAREIHDAISQHLFGLRMITAGMRRSDPHNEQLRAIERITEEALRDMRALLWELRPAGPDGVGLGPALEQMCAAYRDRHGLTVDADLDILADRTLPEPVEHALLRVAQEACTNAVRHGNASRLTVSMTCRDGQVEFAVTDDGNGFDGAAAHAGSGLQHIRDRVAELGGTVHIDSSPGAGAAVTVHVPVP